jgi:pseudouridine-5'-phosphate glycosidase/pseudouridine kinase
MLMTRWLQQKSFVCHVTRPLSSTSLIGLSALVTHWQIGMINGALFGVPIPERYESVGETLQQAVEAALAEADQNGMNQRGKEVTPWLLKRIGELTKGASLVSSQW